MKKIFSLVVVAICTINIWAYDFKSDNLYYNITNNSEPYSVEVTYQDYDSRINYSNLSTIIIPETVTDNGTTYSVTTIGERAFQYCSGLTSITIPNSVKSIGSVAFYGCSRLSSITIPNSVTSIGGSAFAYCESLTSVTIPNSVTSIESYAFYDCSSLTSVTIPNSVTSIGEGAFNGCSGLTSVTIGNSVKSIGEQAFYRCSGLTSITIPNSVTEIGVRAFAGCSGLTSITLPNSVTSIGDEAFAGCSGLTSIESLAETPPTLGTDAFYNVSTSIPVYVPCGSVSAYQSAEGWKAFTNIQCGSNEPSTDLENTHSQSPMANRQKLLRDGQLIILRDGVEYNALGQIIKE